MEFTLFARERTLSLAFVCTAVLGVGACSGDTAGTRPMHRQNTPGAVAGTGSGGAGGSFGNRTGGARAPLPITPAGGGPCVNLQCQQKKCAGGGSTTVSGTVYDPAGTNPLYNVAVYVPNEAVQPLPTGATCDSCDSLYTGKPIAAALTDPTGKFTMPNVPEGTNIPLIVQVGKWRRQFTLPTVTSCTDNPVPDGMLRLPRNRMEGDIPKIAISTGMADTLECLLRRVGVDATEFVPGPSGDGRIHIFQGAPLGDAAAAMAIAQLLGLPSFSASPNTMPPGATSSTALWNSVDSLKAYDIVLLSCEGQETQGMNQQALYDYANSGGRVFASHFHYSWFNSGPFGMENLATWSPGANDVGNITGTIVTTLPDGMPFPKGVALQAWLENVGALQGGALPIAQARHNADVNAMHTPSQPWILADQGSMAPGAAQYFSFNTPTKPNTNVDGIPHCGRVVFSDLHVGAASGDNPINPVPMSCGMNALSPQEAALEFMLFDLSSCLTPDEVPPTPPVVE